MTDLDALVQDARGGVHTARGWQAVALKLADALEALRAERNAALAREAALVEAARDLYESVQMDESVGICLSDRVPTLRLGSLLASSQPQAPPEEKKT